MKNFYLSLLVLFSAFTLVSCGKEEPHKCPEVPQHTCPTPEDKDLTPAPGVVGEVYHWMPGASEAKVTATIDLKGANANSLMVVYGNEVLEDVIDYEFVENKLTIFGAYLTEKEFAVKDHIFKIITSQGTTDFVVSVVTNPLNTSILTKEIQGINMSDVANYKPAAVIAKAPALLITEFSVDNGMYDYIEVFNNTASEYNLKGHRLVFGDTTRQTLLLTKELIEQPSGMSGAAYIYNDYLIPALSSAYIWVVAANPWQVSTTADRQISEVASASKLLFGDSEDNLSIAKFKAIYKMGASELVFPVRMQYILFNNTTSFDTATGLGLPVQKAAGWTGSNSSMDNRGFQIQKLDMSLKINVTAADTQAPAGSAYYTYDMGVMNQEEDVYVNGVLDKSKITVYGGRQSINAFYARKVYFDSLNQYLGYGKTKANAIDAYNNGSYKVDLAYKSMYENAVLPISTALIYGKLITDGTETKLSKWTSHHSLEYTIPVEGSTLMRFIPREQVEGYSEFYKETDVLKAFKVSGIAPSVEEVLGNRTVVVPIDPSYPTDYLVKGYNTCGKTGWFNFFGSKPQ